MLLLATPRVSAFSNPDVYGSYPTGNPTELGGGAGRYFTGSPADGYGCSVCHTATEKYSFPVLQKGLPLDGYVPGKSYAIELSWPQATQAELQALAMGMEPSTELIAEFVSEEGGAGGTIAFVSSAELEPPQKYSGLYCSVAPGVVLEPDEWADRYAMSILDVEPGRAPIKSQLSDNPVEPTELRCDVVGEEGEEGAHRCIIALRPCGATSLKFIWTAPQQWRGPIWFSAGFVTTYDASAVPNDRDFVTELTIPMNAAYEGATYQNRLNSGCSIASTSGSLGSRGARGARGVCVIMAMGLYLMWSRRRRTRRHGAIRGATPAVSGAHGNGAHAGTVLRALAVIGTLLACVGCDEDPVLITRVSGAVGLYEPRDCTNCDKPKCRVGVWDVEDGIEMIALVPHDSANMTGMPGDGSVPPAAGVGVPVAGATALSPSPVPQALTLAPRQDDETNVVGQVKFDFTTTQLPGTVSKHVERYCPDGSCQPHYWAAWIETYAGDYVRTLGTYKTLYGSLNLQKYWGMGVDCEGVEKFYLSSPDVTATATVTPQLHGMHEVIWDGILGNGAPAPEGTYRLRIEVVIDEDPNNWMKVVDEYFDLTGIPMTTVVPASPPLASLTITSLPPASAAAVPAGAGQAVAGAAAPALGAAAVAAGAPAPAPAPAPATAGASASAPNAP